ncbi:MAG: NAD(P)H-dependent oxidoreductase [Betaproteobacteria bacterium]|nr:NAD(P)H-dependent oxidoreductase [Betaproteobacteria bacterium]MDH5221944.1 NAD(P)H-dependent oxidoreductase [Betaproteobacteria bacterium]MDH5349507.1 NAD(P)H-dependent oxidoreductase [Betaproteobacteria bacterium]
MKTLLIVYHTGGVKTAQMSEAVERGARAEEGVRVVVKRCADAGPQDVLAADGLILGTPENFGYMSGMMKDFLERIFYACEGKLEGRPWALFVGAGQDGSGAVTSVERIVTGLRLKKIREPIVVVKDLKPEQLAACEQLGAAMAAGLAAGIL